ncbi:ectoine hydroxylase [Salinibacillus xinjiangensis]|uniref:Ectoine hydroxylase n=1 Tax=Salinibacillus xinjiangensis TaxID=1229268 RepID=A0A6G1X2M9_9BACI|nr:ectoine hydroxylase [Salinibacillus xinjiangensis]MRG85243.1 ectoine hydroxylase [Salinibacillus xinjiangensis]
MTDFYPSRISATPSIMERKDPGLYGSKDSGPLKHQELDFYEQNGYIFFEKLFSDDEVDVLRKKLDGTMDDHKSVDKPHVVREQGSDEIRSIFDVHKNTEFFQKLSAHEKLVNIAQQLLGSQVYINQSRINFKPGFKGKEFYWHSDFETWHVEDGMPRMRAVSCSIILTDNYEYNGPLMLIPGSQNYYVQCASGTPDSHFEQSLKKQEFGTPDHNSLKWLVGKSNGRIDRATGPAGSVLFFESNIMHGSSGNISPFPRSNVFFVFNSIENKLEQPFSELSPRPEFLANRENVKPIQPQAFDLSKKLVHLS